MSNPLVRNILAAVAGVIVAGLVVGIVEAVGHLIFPPPAGLDITNPDDQARLMEIIPLGAKIAVVVAWFMGALAGIATARKISNRSWPAWVPMLLMIAASVWTTTLFPHPVWMVVCAVVLPLIALYLVGRLIPTEQG